MVGQKEINQRIYMHNPWAQTINSVVKAWGAGWRGSMKEEKGASLMLLTIKIKFKIKIKINKRLQSRYICLSRKTNGQQNVYGPLYLSASGSENNDCLTRLLGP